MINETIEQKIKDATVIKIEPDDAVVWVFPEFVPDRDFYTIKSAMLEWCKDNNITSKHIVIRSMSVSSLVGLVNGLDEGTKNKLRNELATKDE